MVIIHNTASNLPKGKGCEDYEKRRKHLWKTRKAGIGRDMQDSSSWGGAESIVRKAVRQATSPCSSLIIHHRWGWLTSLKITWISVFEKGGIARRPRDDHRWNRFCPPFVRCLHLPFAGPPNLQTCQVVIITWRCVSHHQPKFYHLGSELKRVSGNSRPAL